MGYIQKLEEDSADEVAGDGEPTGPPSSGGAAARAADTEGRRPSIGDIYRHYRQYVWTKLRRPDVDPEAAEGLLLEVFLVMDRQIQENGMPNNVAAMLATIARHLVCNHLRSASRRPRFDSSVDVGELPCSQPDPEQRLRCAQRRDIVDAILARMPPDAAMLIRLIDLGELTHADVAGILDRPAATARVQHHRARAKFRELVERLHDADLKGAA